MVDTAFKITILWAALAEYSVAFFREIAKGQGCRLQLTYQPIRSDAPYSEFDLSFCDDALEDTPAKRNFFGERINNFRPHVILMSSWSYRHYMKLAKKFKNKGVYIVSAMDNQYRGTLKQRIGIAISPFFLKPSINTFFVPGDRQAYFAKKLGYDDVMYGLWAADVDRFSTQIPVSQRSPSFLYAGRLIDEKNIRLLLDGYASYRQRCSSPWVLKIAGTGPLKKYCERVPGVHTLGFIQPPDLPAVFEASRCFILPSSFEQWGVVIHEAASSGLPIISSYACGASTQFVREGVNGYIIPPTAESIENAMLRVTQKSDTELQEMSRQSVALANLWTPAKLAGYFIDSIRWRIGAKQCRHQLLAN